METPYELQPEDIRQPLSFIEAARRYAVAHIFRVPQLKDWLAYDAALGIVLADVATEAGVGVAHRANRTAALGLLWDRLILRVEGYAAPAEGEDWKAAVPFAHRIAAAQPRTLVLAVPYAPAEIDEEGWGIAAPAPYAPGETPVQLLAAGGDYPPLVHWFRRPEAAHTVEFDRLQAERIYFRATQREGAKAVVPPMLAGCVKLYDQLIERVEGYTVHGADCVQPSRSSSDVASANGPCMAREQAVQHMDAWHKQAALRALFLPPQPADDAEALAA